MSDIFNFKRFGNFFVSDFKRCLANYGLSLLILSLTGLMAYLITIFVSLIFAIPMFVLILISIVKSRKWAFEYNYKLFCERLQAL